MAIRLEAYYLQNIFKKYRKLLIFQKEALENSAGIVTLIAKWAALPAIALEKARYIRNKCN